MHRTGKPQLCPLKQQIAGCRCQQTLRCKRGVVLSMHGLHQARGGIHTRAGTAERGGLESQQGVDQAARSGIRDSHCTELGRL